MSVAATPALAQGAAPSAVTETAADAAFHALGERWLAEVLRLSPVFATRLGDHSHDARLPDVSAAGRAADRALAAKTLSDLARIDRSRLSRANQVDAALLRDQLEYALFDADRLRSWARDPLDYSSTAGAALFSLSEREFAALPDRLRSATGRLEALPTYLAQARAALDPARVPRIHAETAARQNAGLNGLIDGLAAKADALPAAERPRMAAAAARAKSAVAEHQRWLDGTLVAEARGEERIGAELYDEKLRLALNATMPRAEIRARGERNLAELRARMYDVSRTILAGRPGAPATPAKPSKAEQQAAIAAALAVVSADVTAKDGVVPFARETLTQATAFAQAKDLISFPTQTFTIIDMPEFQRGVAVAYADMPGALERDQRGFYAVSPIPANWTDAQAGSFLREYNRWAIHELSIHEAVPGHLLQLAHANRYQNTLRAVLQSGPMIEGWACYSQDVMADAGYLDRDPRYLLAHYKFQMRAPVNALLDFDFHTGALTREAAIKLMTEDAFQEEREAAGKWTRLRLSAAQLPTYFVGYQEWLDLRAAAEQRPGFALKAFHDQALSYGSPPVRFVRQLMFDEPIR